MALIRCPDCDHEVSELARVCSNCGHSLQSSSPPKLELGEPLDPIAVARARMKQLARSVGDGANACLRCGQDVTHDGFRAKAEGGYLCGDCRDAQMERSIHVQQRLRRWFGAVVLLFVVGALVFGAMTAVTWMERRKPARTIR